MRSRYRFTEDEGIYFVTCTVIHWLPAFTRREDFELLLAPLAHYRRTRAIKLYAYVLMDNHLHLVIEGKDVSRTMKAFKSYTAKRILAQAEQSGREWLLNQFAFYKKRHKQSSDYQVWQEGVHPQLVQTDAMFEQKVSYIHENPVRRGWVDLPEQWRYSSARNYLADDESVFEIDRLGD